MATPKRRGLTVIVCDFSIGLIIIRTVNGRGSLADLESLRAGRAVALDNLLGGAEPDGAVTSRARRGGSHTPPPDRQHLPTMAQRNIRHWCVAAWAIASSPTA